MSRKSTPYARRLARERAAGGQKSATGLAVTIARCTPYERNHVFSADKIMVDVRKALQGFIDRTLGDAEGKAAFDELANSINEAEIRWAEIGGFDHSTNPALPVLSTAGDALLRARARWERIGQWGLDGRAIQQLKDGVDLFEQVLRASSPRQMHDAALKRVKWYQEQMKSPRAQELMRQRIERAVG